MTCIVKSSSSDFRLWGAMGMEKFLW